MVGSASSKGGIRAVFSVHHGVVGRTSSLYCWGVYKKWRVAGSIGWPPRSPDLTPSDFFLWGYLKAKVYEHRQTLEALKEAIWQEVAAITPEMILKVMDNYRERLHQCINIQGYHLSDVLFKTHWCKTAFCVLSRNKKTFAVSSLVLNLLASQIGEFFLPHPVYYICINFYTVSLVTEYRILMGNILIHIWEVLCLISSPGIGCPEWFLLADTEITPQNMPWHFFTYPLHYLPVTIRLMLFRLISRQNH